MSAAVAYSTENKWADIGEGVILLLLGIAAIAWPGITFYTFTVLFGLYALAVGVINVVSGILHIKRGWAAVGKVIVGGLLVAAGSYIFNHPGIAAATLVLLVGFAFIVRGVFEVVFAISEDLPHKALSIVAGLIGILVGLILLRYPIGGGLAYVWVLGIYALISGPILIAVGLGAGSDDKPTAKLEY